MSKTSAPRPASFAALVQQFFTDYLVTQRAVSPRTVASYRDALMLFLDFAHKRLGKSPTALRLSDIEPDLILAFLDHLESQRHNAVRSRNLGRAAGGIRDPEPRHLAPQGRRADAKHLGGTLATTIALA